LSSGIECGTLGPFLGGCMRRLIVGGGLFGLGSCGSGPCKDPNGTYAVKFSERSGNCGSFESVSVFPPAPGSGSLGNPACQTRSADKCVVRSNACKMTSNGETMTFSGEVSWDEDGDEADGLVSIGMTSPTKGSCYSTYDVTYHRR